MSGWGRQKPDYGYGINPGHHLATGLVQAFLINEGGGTKVYNLLGTDDVGTLQSGASWTATAGGVGLDCTSGGVDLQRYGPADLTTSEMTYVSVLVPDTFSANAMVYDGDTDNLDQFRLLYLSASTAWRWRVHTSAGGVNCDATDSPTAGVPIVIAGRYDGANLSVWKDGVKISSDVAHSGAITSNSGDDRSIGVRGPTTSDDFRFTGKVLLSLVYNRALTDGEMLEIGQTPYAMIEYPQRVFDAGDVGTTSTTTTSSSTTTTSTSSTTSSSTTSTSTTSSSTTTTSTSTTSSSTTSSSTTSTSTSSTTTSYVSTSTSTTSTSTTIFISSTTTTTFTFRYEHGHLEGWASTVSTTTSTTTPPAFYYRYGRDRMGGISEPAGTVDVVLPSPSASNLDPYSLKSYVDFDEKTGIFDGAGANRLDDGTTLKNFNVLAPQHRVSFSSTTSTTSTTTTVQNTTTTTSVPWYFVSEVELTAGAIAAGTLRNLDAADDSKLQLTELAATPGFIYSFRFGETNDQVPTGRLKVIVQGYYDGNPAHVKFIYAWNFQSLTWVRLTAAADDLPDDSSDQDYSWLIPETVSDYLDNGRVWLKIEHTSAGVNTHDLYLDHMRLRTASTTTTSTTSTTTTV